MKKLIALSIVLVLICGAVFAQDAAPGVVVGTWSRMGTTLLQTYGYHDKDLADASFPSGAERLTDTSWARMGVGTAWLWGLGRVGAYVAGQTENVGVHLELGYSNSAITPWDNTYIWAKPIDQLKIFMGMMKWDNFRGMDTTDNSFSALGTIGMASGLFHEQIFARYETGNGILFELTPMENLTVFAGLGNGATFKSIGENGKVTTTYDGTSVASQYWRAIQAGVGYNLEGVGLIRAQFKGNKDAYLDTEMDTNAHMLQLAWKMDPKIVENLSLDIGIKGYIPNTSGSGDAKKTYWSGMGFGIAGKYDLDALHLAFGVGGNFAGNYSQKSGSDEYIYWTPPQFQVNLEPSYDVEGIGTIGVTASMQIKGPKAVWKGGSPQSDSDMDYTGDSKNAASVLFAAGLYYQKSFGNGHFQIGVAGKFDTPTYDTPASPGAKNEVYQGTTVVVPMVIEVAL